jgi:hypothetical protein
VGFDLGKHAPWGEMSISALLHTVRKAFLTKFARVHYSQFGEDVVLREMVGKKRDGFYVDVGCYHPKRFSNTYWLHRRGWRGINIDMEKHKIEMFRLARPHDVNVVAAISDKNEKLRISKTRDHDLEARLVEMGAEAAGAEIVETRTLTEVIDATKYRGRKIDLLSVDAEDYDLQAIRSLQWSVYAPAFVIVETREADVYGVLRSEINLFMESVGYVLRSWTVKSLIYTPLSRV